MLLKTPVISMIIIAGQSQEILAMADQLQETLIIAGQPQETLIIPGQPQETLIGIIRDPHHRTETQPTASRLTPESYIISQRTNG